MATADGRGAGLVLVDAGGRVWSWPASADEPRLHVALGVRPFGPVIDAPAFVTTWAASAPGGDDDEEDLTVVDQARQVLIGTEDGFLIHLPYPFGGER
jgi:hypothetical protein